MSTRSNIAIEDPKTKKVKVIYVHSDGYPYGVGKCLVDNYNHYDLAKQLFTEGDASYLGDTFEECSFYGRDWNRKEEPAEPTEMSGCICMICKEISILNIFIYSKIINGTCPRVKV